MSIEKVDLAAKLALFSDHWAPRAVARLNELDVMVVKVLGEFVWHAHEEDELFLCWRGAFSIELEDRDPVLLGAGQLFVVPRGTRHRPVADAGPAWALLLERPETAQYGRMDRVP